MKMMQQAIENRVEAMISEVITLLRESAMEALSRALHAPSRLVVATKSTKGQKRVGTVKPHRSVETILKLSEQLYGQMVQTPGETMARYASNLAMTRAELVVPGKRLKAAGRVRSVGERTHTRYFPMGNG
jgi:hypothetical protein